MIAEPSPFHKLFELGYERLVPIVPPGVKVSPHSSLAKRPGSLGKAVGIKNQLGLWRGYDWLRAPSPTLEVLAEWAAMGAGVGIRTGAGLVALDIDTLSMRISEAVSELAISMLGWAPSRVGKAPKVLMPYRTSEPVPYMRVEFTGHEGKQERIELLSDDRQFVAYGIHATTGEPYDWGDGIEPFDKLPIVTRAQLEAYFAELTRILPAAIQPATTQTTDRANVNQSNLTGDLTHIASAVAALPNDNDFAPTYDDYIRVGAAIKGATQQDPQLGLNLFLEWAEKWTGGENDLEVAEADYKRIKPPYELGAKWLYDKAEQYAPASFNSAGVWFEPVTELDNPFTQQERQIPREPKRRFDLIPFATARASALTDAQAPLIKGLLDQQAMTVLYGASNTGKTFVAMDMAFHIAAGLPWAGLRTTCSPVVYIAAEGGRGARRRVDALYRKYGQDPAGFYLIMTSVDLLRADADLNPLIDAVRQIGILPGLVVLDTLSRAIAGGDENSSTDMGALVKNLDTLRAALSAHVLIVHHSGKDAAKGARGHSLLRAATDTEIEIADNQISVTKQRDMDGTFSTAFSLEIHELGQDSDGDKVTSCTILLGAPPTPEADAASVTGKERELYEQIALLLDTHATPEKGVSVAEVTAHMAEVAPSVTAESIRNNIKRLASKRILKRIARGQFVLNIGKSLGQNRLTQVVFEKIEDCDSVNLGQALGQSIFD